MSLDLLAKQFDDFLIEAHRLKSAYASRITLLIGLETEFITPLDLDRLQNLLAKHGDRIEYLVGSVHHVNDIPIDFDKPTFEKSLHSFSHENISDLSRMENFLSAYFDAQHEVMRLFHPEVIGHFDLCRLYNPDIRFSSFPLAWEKLDRNVQFAIQYGALFEVNAAAFRKGWHCAYPAQDVLEV